MAEGAENKPDLEELNPKDLEYLFEHQTIGLEMVDLTRAKKAVINPARGFINLSEESGKGHESLYSYKSSLIREIARRMEDDPMAEELLWQTAISPEPGFDINKRALDSLATNKLSTGFLEKMGETLSKGTAKEKAFAAFVLNKFPHYLSFSTEKQTRIKELAEKSQDWSYETLKERAQVEGETLYGEAFKNWAKLEWYKSLLSYYEEGKVSPDNSAIRRKILSGIEDKISKIHSKGRLQRYSKKGVSLGLELQGVDEESVSTIGETDDYYFTLYSPEDYVRFTKIANFYFSPDPYFEFSTKPSFSPVEICLLVQTLVEMETMDFEGGTVGLDINLGNLTYHKTDFREPMTLHLLMIAANYSNVPDSVASKESWMIAIKNQGNMDNRENVLEGVSVEGVSELRVFTMKDVKNLYETLFNLKIIGDLAFENQQGKKERDFNRKHAAIWQSLTLKASKLFLDNGFLTPYTEWSQKDLIKLSSFVDSDGGKDFVKDLRALIREARAAKLKEDKLVLESEEALPSKMERVVMEWTDWQIRARETIYKKVVRGELLRQLRNEIMYPVYGKAQDITGYLETSFERLAYNENERISGLGFAMRRFFRERNLRLFLKLHELKESANSAVPSSIENIGIS